jgi:uncharacterized protein YjiS (DUF1127 family)
MTTAKSHLLLDRRTAVYADQKSRWSLAQFVDILLEWHERSRQRRQLLSLDDRLLKDIGISRVDAEREAGKPFWKR